MSFYSNIILHCSFLLVTTVLAVDVTGLCLNPFLLSCLLCPSHLLFSGYHLLLSDDFSIFCVGSFTLAHGCFGLRAGGWRSPLYISDPDPSFLVWKLLILRSCLWLNLIRYSCYFWQGMCLAMHQGNCPLCHCVWCLFIHSNRGQEVPREFHTIVRLKFMVHFEYM